MKVMRVKSVKEKVTSGEASGQAPWKTEPDLPITKTTVNTSVIPEGTVEKGVNSVVNAGKRSSKTVTSQAIPVNKFGPDPFSGPKSKTLGNSLAPPHVKPIQLPKNKSGESQASKETIIPNPGERPKLEISKSL